jgi:hypothetical protein
MDNRIALVVGGITLAVLAGVSLERAPSPPTQSPGTEDSAKSSKPAPQPRVGTYQTGSDLVLAFFGVDTEGDAASHPPLPEYGLEILIASLPDPHESHLDWSFDAQLEAIRRAFEVSGFVTDRFWLPAPGDSVPVIIPGDTVLRVAAEVRPGVILFRQADPSIRELRLLYMVEELPTSGVHKPALAAALEERDSLYGPRVSGLRVDRPARLRIIGPTFSGSAVSLRRTLLSRLHIRDTVEIISGSATDLSNRQTLTSEAGPVLRFSATVHPNEDMSQALKDLVLGPLDIAPHEVALLRESSTQYGGSVVHPEGYLDVPFPMSISSLRSAYLRAPAAPATTGPSPGLPSVTPAPKLPLDLLDQPKPRENLPLTSALTPPSIDLVFDDIARTLTRHGIRLVGLLATDVRDKLFLGAELRRRMRDVQLFTYESSALYLRPEHNQALRGMLVLSTYPLAMESQWWARGPTTSLRLSFSTDAAEGAYNATLFQLENPEAALDYASVVDSARPLPDIWLSTVGRSGFLPLAVLARGPYSECYLAVRGGSPESCPSAATNTLVSGVRSRLGSAGGIPFMAITTSAVILGLLAWFTWASERPTARSLREALPAPFPPGENSDPRPDPEHQNATALQLLPRVLEGSLRLHERLYRGLALLAVLGVFLHVSAIRIRLWWGGEQGTPVWLIVAALVALVSLVSLGHGIRTAWRIFCDYRQDAVQYGLRLKWGTLPKRLLWRLEVGSRGIVVAFGILYLALTIWFVVQVWSLGGPQDLRFNLYFHRASQIGSLASPLLPLLLAGLGYAAWCAWHVRRISLLRQHCVFELACDRELQSAPGLAGTIAPPFREELRRAAMRTEQVRWRLFLVMPNPGAIILVFVIVSLLFWLWGEFGRTFEAIALPRTLGDANAFDWLLGTSICATLFATTWATYRFLAVWDALAECLEAVHAMPMVTAFDRLPRRATRLVRLQLPGGRDDTAIGAIADRQWIHLRGIYARKVADFDKEIPSASTLRRRLDRLMHTGLRVSEPSLEAQAGRFRGLHGILREFWTMEPLRGQMEALVTGKKPEGPEAETADTSTCIRRTFTDGVELWVKTAEEYLAVQIVDYIEWVMHHLRILALFLLLSLLITTLLLSGYPFSPRQLVKLSFIVLLLATVGAILYVNTQMNRNEILSRIGKTTPGRITWDARFIVNVLTFGVLPILTLLGSEFPELRSTLFSWLDPLKTILKQ